MAILLVVLMLVSVPAFAQTDFSGEWAVRNNEDPGQPPLGDYLGVPMNAAGRQRAETTAESIWGIPEYQCRPHSPPHQWRGVGGSRFQKEIDPLTRELTAYHVQWWRSLDRVIYLDGRPHPPAWAPHTWTGFSTGEWVGNTLVVTTTHLKDGYLKRSGPQTSDMYTMTEYFTRHGDLLLTTEIIDDPIYLDEPFIQSTTHQLAPNTQLRLEPCTTSFDENGGSDPHFVPHYLPGKNPFLSEWLEGKSWIPQVATRGGAETTYPEYRLKLSGSAAYKPAPLSRSAVDVPQRVTAQSPHDGQVHVMPVQGNVYMLVVDGSNVAVSVGPEGALLVDTGPSAMADKLLATIKQMLATTTAPATNKCVGLTCPSIPWGWSSPFIDSIVASTAPPRPIRFIFNTSLAPELIGGNEKLAAAGVFPRAGNTAIADVQPGASVIAHENVLSRLSAPASAGKSSPTSSRSWPTDTYHRDFYTLSEWFNGEPVLAYHEPNAYTDGDSIVFFRHSEVISAGEILSTVSYPVIDVAQGGTIQGVINGLNHILDVAVAEQRSQGGTWIIPGHGRLCDVADVASYRNMAVMIRDRVQDMIKNGRTLEQVKAAKPTMDFDGRYGSTTGSWTTDMFVEAVYRTLKK
jgi:cyclase